MSAARDLVSVLVEPARAAALDSDRWTQILAVARAEQMMGTLAARVGDLAPVGAAAILADAKAAAKEGRRQALWEAEMARRALHGVVAPLILLKGTAFAAAGRSAGSGRAIGDLDVLVPRNAIDQVEAALLAHGWMWVKSDSYDDRYYRQWMHELPPMIHPERDRMIDVHHTILPLTARQKPDAVLLIKDAEPLGNGLAMLSREDVVLHAAIHLLADGDLAGGLRNLWDIDRLLREFADDDPEYWDRLTHRAQQHGVVPVIARALRLSHHLFATPVPPTDRGLGLTDRLYLRRLLARDGWGRATRPGTRLAFYIRSHWLRMPPLLLARHLWIKWRRSGAAEQLPPRPAPQ